MLRFVFILVLMFLFVAPIYHILHKNMIKIKSELENENEEVDDRLTDLKQKHKKLKGDCDDELESAKKRIQKVSKIKNQL